MKKALHNLVLRLQWFLLRRVIAVIPLRGRYRVCCRTAKILSTLLVPVRKVIEAELFALSGQKYSRGELKRIASQSVEIDIKRRLENLFLGQFTREFVQDIITVEGREHLEGSIGKGRGTIIMLSHFGSFLLIPIALGFMGYPANQLTGQPMYDKQGSMDEKVFKLRKRLYEGLPCTFFQARRHMKQAMKALKNNELLAIAFDGTEGDKWIGVNFLGRRASFSPGPFRIARSTGATLLPVFLVRQPDDSQKLIIEPCLELSRENDEEAALQQDVQRAAEIVERYVWRYPSHFAMIMHITRRQVEQGIIKKDLFD